MTANAVLVTFDGRTGFPAQANPAMAPGNTNFQWWAGYHASVIEVDDDTVSINGVLQDNSPMMSSQLVGSTWSITTTALASP